MPVATKVRKTGVIARIVDDNLNSWEDFSSFDFNIDVIYPGFNGDNLEYDQAFWWYRGQAAVCARTTDGAIVRVRIGDGTSADRTIYRQIITDPTDADSWEDWTQLYTGSHYAIAIEADASAAAGYRIYHAKSDGLYMDNVLRISLAGIIRIKPTAFDTGRIYFQTVEQDIDGHRKVRWWYAPNLPAGTSYYGDAANYRWYRSDLICLKGGGDSYYRFRSMAHDGGARERTASQVLTSEVGILDDEVDAYNTFNQYESVRFHKGPSAHAGYKIIENMFATSMSSYPWTGAYYLFYNERHFDAAGHQSSNLKNPLFWSRSISYPYFLSAPTPVGYTIWGFAGVVEWGDYIYICGNGRVLRRPKDEVVINLTDYVMEGNYDIPRDNQKATGMLVCPNPGNVLGEQLGLTDADQAASTGYRLELGIGQFAPGDDQYTYKRDESWRVSTLRKRRDDQQGGKKQHLEVGFANFWDRMENPFLDTIYLPGKLDWNDWQDSAPNQLFNYSNDTDEFSESTPDTDVFGIHTTFSNSGTISGLGGKSITLFAGWHGENGYIQARLWGAGGIVFRYVDPENFYYAKVVPESSLSLIRYKDGTPSTLGTTAFPDSVPLYLAVDFRWGRVTIDSGDYTLGPLTLVDPEIYTGFVGWVSSDVSNLTIREWHEPLTTKDILRGLLAYADEHEVELELDEETAAAPIIDFTMGPQSDLASPEQAFRQTLEASKLQVVWLEDE